MGCISGLMDQDLLNKIPRQVICKPCSIRAWQGIILEETAWLSELKLQNNSGSYSELQIMLSSSGGGGDQQSSNSTNFLQPTHKHRTQKEIRPSQMGKKMLLSRLVTNSKNSSAVSSYVILPLAIYARVSSLQYSAGPTYWDGLTMSLRIYSSESSKPCQTWRRTSS